MNPHLQRALLLLNQSRNDLAEEELRQALTQDPDDAMAHAALAICLSNQKKYQPATEAAHQAIHLSPDQSFVHFAHSIVLLQRNRPAEAQAAVEQAIQLDPYEPDYFAQLAQAHYVQRRWRDALNAADRGLELDPEDVGCTNWRALALVKLGGKIEASQALDTALRRNPEDAMSHANQGWSLIEQGMHQQAMEHFKEALRLDPQLDWARMGIIEAMKARYFIYRIMLKWFLFMSKLSSTNQWLIVIGGYIGYVMISRLNRENPEWSHVLIPLLIAYVAFALMTWIASPLFNLALRLNRFGRLALSREQTITANWVGLCVLLALGFLVYWGITKETGGLLGSLSAVFMIPPINAYFHCDPGKPRILIRVVLAVMGLVGLCVTIPPLVAPYVPDAVLAPMVPIFRLATGLFVFVALGTQFAANALTQMETRH